MIPRCVLIGPVLLVAAKPWHREASDECSVRSEADSVFATRLVGANSW